MIIKKILNNNAAIVTNDNNEDIVITGLGLAFQKKKGDPLDKDKIERIFTLEHKEISNKLKSLISEIPLQHIKISEEIIEYAKGHLEESLDEKIYLTLTDHISFALERMKKGLEIKNPMLWEVKRFYPKEFNIGKKALEMIEDEMGVQLPEDEAASMALHLVNAELNQNMHNVVNLVKIIQETLNIIKYYFKREFNEDTLIYHRLVTHLKFFAQRILTDDFDVAEDEVFFKMIKNQYPEAFKCGLKIKNYVGKTYDYEIPNQELTYLTVHIQRIIYGQSST